MPKNDDKDSEVAEKTSKAVEAVKSPTPWPLITVGVFASVVGLAIVLLVCSAFLNHQASNRGMANERFGMNDGDAPGRMYSHRENRSDNWQTSVSIVRGVVTAIDGDTLTVSGGGDQVQVKRTSSTVVGGDEMDVAVNDTVVVASEKADDGSMTAIRIMIRNDAPEEGMMFDAGPRTHV